MEILVTQVPGVKGHFNKYVLYSVYNKIQHVKYFQSMLGCSLCIKRTWLCNQPIHLFLESLPSNPLCFSLFTLFHWIV